MRKRFAVTPSELEFEDALETFRTEAETVAQYFYANLTMHTLAAADSRIYQAINRHAAFWNTALHALQAATFIAMYRLFDEDSQGRADNLLRFLESNGPTIFSRSALRERIRARDGVGYGWVDDAYEPTVDDFHRLRGEVRRLKNMHDKKYRPIRSGVFAHLLASPSDMFEMFKETRYSDLQELSTFFPALHETLVGMYYNGGPLFLQRTTTDVNEILASGRQRTAHERLVSDTAAFLRDLVKDEADS